MQYVITREHRVLLHALEQLNKIPLMEQRGQQERLHLKSLRSKVEGERDMLIIIDQYKEKVNLAVSHGQMLEDEQAKVSAL